MPEASSSTPAKKETYDLRVRRLFRTNGMEDLTRTQEERNRFLNFLTDHKIGSRLLDSSHDNPVLKAVVCFCVKWRRLRYIEHNYSPSAVVRFLTQHCEIRRNEVSEKAIANTLGLMIKNGYDKLLYEDVSDYF